MKRTFAIIAVLVSLCFSAQAKLSVKYPCSDNMVLQQQTKALVWGHANAGAKVTVTPSWNPAQSQVATTDEKGVWKVYLKTPAASYTNYSISVTGDNDKMTINNVLVGEVWLASGQSNMEMPIRGFYNCPTEGAAAVIAAAPLTNRVRMFTVKVNPSKTPLDDVQYTDGWQDAGPQTVGEMSATAFFFARQLNATLDVPVGIVSFPRGGSRIEGWLPREMLEAYGDEDLDKEYEYDYHVPYQMYNGMQHPIQGYTAKGFIWYQGCSNVGKHDQFVARMNDLVGLWREQWGDSECKMPFYQVEIAPYRYGSGDISYSALLREAQHNSARVIPNSGIVVTNDLVYSYEIDQIHPCQKTKVGERLAYLALNRDYGFSKIACYSPEAIEVFKQEGRDSEICVRLSNCWNGLDRWQEIQGLEVCGSEHIFKPVSYAHYEWEDGGFLRIRCEGVWDPCEVRYGWGDFCPGNLHNAEGLPVTPFDIKLNK